jgi:uncharacterized iron-regulated protein
MSPTARRARPSSTPRALLLSAALGALGAGGACSSSGSAAEDAGPAPARVEGDHAFIDTVTGEPISFEGLVDALAGYDVVFLGELHDHDVVHRLQAELTEALLARRGDLIISMEMFERDAQPAVDAYLAGEIDEQAFLARSHPWPNYAQHYRPAIELAKRDGLLVLAANVPRPLAARVAREGLLPVLAAPHAPRQVYTPATGAYRERFDAIMTDHAPPEGVPAPDPEAVFASQCIKDDAMAESIADALALHPGTLVVHWCGRFHSDAHLGTVERLAWRRPDLSLAVVTPSTGADLGRPLSDEERVDGDYVLRVLEQPGEGED